MNSLLGSILIRIFSIVAPATLILGMLYCVLITASASQIAVNLLFVLFGAVYCLSHAK